MSNFFRKIYPYLPDFLKKEKQGILGESTKIPSPPIPPKEILIEERAKFLNGQLRGVINKKAREENLEMIEITLLKIFEDGHQIGYSECNSEYALKEIKEQLN